MLSIHRDIRINIEEMLDETSQKPRKMDINLQYNYNITYCENKCVIL